MPLSFVVAVNNREIFQNNIQASPLFARIPDAQVIVQEGFPSASKAYNDGFGKAENDIVVFAHQDIVFPAGWADNLQKALHHLERVDPNWGVLGCYGSIGKDAGRGYVFSNGMGVHGRPFDDPIRVQTLDEIVLVLRKSSPLRFDESLPHFHFYGADICLSAAELGMNSYAISAYCVHNQQENIVLPKEFYECYWYARRKWRNHLPIWGTCIFVTTTNYDLYWRKMWEMYARVVRRRCVGAERVQNGLDLLRHAELTPQYPTLQVTESAK